MHSFTLTESRIPAERDYQPKRHFFCIRCERNIKPDEQIRMSLGRFDSTLENVPVFHYPKCPGEILPVRPLTRRVPSAGGAVQ